MPVVSIIVPVYNAERFLRETLDSLLGQSCSDFELILVNDGSTDGSAAILEEYRLRDGRVRVLTTENHGAYYARNTGLELARGEYVLFFDSDDILLPNALEQMMAAFEDGIDLVMGGKEILGEERPARQPVPERVYDAQTEEGLKWLFRRDPFPGNKLFRRATLQRFSVRFWPARIGEDMCFYYCFLAVCRKAALLDEAVCLYRVVSGSLSHSYDDRYLEIPGCLQGAERFARNNGASDAYFTQLDYAAIHAYKRCAKKTLRVTDAGQRRTLLETLPPLAFDAAARLGDRIDEDAAASLAQIRKIYGRRRLYESPLYTWYRKFRR